MNVLWIIVLVVVAGMLIAKLGQGASRADTVAAREKIKQGATVLDVRTPSEYQSGHAHNATNIPLAELKGRLSELGDKKTAIVVYCAAGVRSAKAARILKSAGFTDITDAGRLSNLDP